MLPIVHGGLKAEEELRAHEILSNIVTTVLNLEQGYKEEDNSAFFPIELYKERKEKYDEVIKDLYIWAKDPLKRDIISPVHEYALHSILITADEYEEDYKVDCGESLFFHDVPEYKLQRDKDKDEDELHVGDLATIIFYLESCFRDYDFTDVDMYIDSIKTGREQVLMNFYNVDFMDYLDLMPIEVEKYYIEKYKDKING